MNNEEKKAIEWVKNNLENTIKLGEKYGFEEAIKNQTTILNLIEKQQKEIEDKKEEIYTIAKINYILGQTDERSQWYKKINEKIEEYKKMLLSCNRFSDVDRIKAINERILECEELIGKEE